MTAPTHTLTDAARIEALEKQLADLRSFCGAIYWLNVHIGHPMKKGTITLEVADHAKLMALVYPRTEDPALALGREP